MSSMSYFDIAMRSYSNIDKQFHLAEEMDWYNLFAAECAQIIEKMLKGILSISKLPENTSPHILIFTHCRCLHVLCTVSTLIRLMHKTHPG